ncbi:28S ribosomal protein S15, mitochondrial-like [Actinia tenebrosa]|uniref:Small ribosomal subunit protein uS15m n=1 Tax=Actinia tenebrosa TaxID=6105 RepID=A0A6P8HNV7_ACTTE|nr:28S ribosomal protein S15, mitochondrial-like [Actinia tenebrosa]
MNTIRSFRSLFYQSLSIFRLQKNVFNDNHVAFVQRVLGLTANRMLSSASGHAVEREEKRFICGYEDIKELHDAPENVKKIFRLENANQRDKNKVIRREIKDKYDGYSERTVAELTLKINTLQSHCKRLPKDKHNKVFLQWLTDQRKKKLKYLEKTNFEKYLEVIKELDIPPLESQHTKWNKYKFRKFKLGVEVKEKRSFLDRRIRT